MENDPSPFPKEPAVPDSTPRPDVSTVATVVTMTTRTRGGEESVQRFVPVEEFEAILDERDNYRRVLSLINEARLDLSGLDPAVQRIVRLLESVGMNVGLACAVRSIIAGLPAREG